MNYLEHYTRLIERAKNRELNCYTESHHIIPRCMSGTDEKDNLVKLTSREHFIAHLLLHKIYPKKYGLIKAINMMCVSSNSHSGNRINNRMYSWLREKLAKEMSRSQLGSNNSQFGTMWIFNFKTQQNKKIKKDEIIPEGWSKGKYKNLEQSNNCIICNSFTKNKKFCCLKCREEFNKDKKVNKKEKQKLDKETKSKNIKLGKRKSTNPAALQQGEYNSQFGSKFMFSLELNIEKRVNKDEIYLHLSNNWKFGQLPIYCESCNKKLTKMTKPRHKC